MIFGFNIPTFLALTAGILLALLLPPYVAMTVGGLAFLVAFIGIMRSPGAPNGLPLYQKPAVWRNNARRYGLMGTISVCNTVMMFRMTEVLTPIAGSPERLNTVVLSAVCLVFAMMGIMMCRTLLGQAIHSQQRADAEAAAGNGPKCICTRKCGMC